MCGRIRGYQFGVTIAFYYSFEGSRQHIWTFAAGLSEVTTRYPNDSCPCDAASYSAVPSFVGNDYFCESGLHSEWNFVLALYSNDVLWDGQDCTATSTCCQFNNPPWFTKNLPNATTDDIELRICTEDSPVITDVPIELIELYVQ